MSHNFMESIREVSISGHHPGGVMRSPLHGATAAQSQGEDPQLKGDNALPLKETSTDLWDGRNGVLLSRVAGGGKECLNVCGST
jgi:hypothetical protein